MAISGGGKPAVSMQVIDDELHELGSYSMAQDVCSDFDEAVRRLLAGEQVRVQKRGTLTLRVAERVEEALREGDA